MWQLVKWRSQNERVPLENICSFLNREGIRAKVSGEKGSYSIHVWTVSDVDRIVTRTEPFITTDNKRLEYEEYKSRRTRNPKRGPRPKTLFVFESGGTILRRKRLDICRLRSCPE